jgi:hypothetical protein
MEISRTWHDSESVLSDNLHTLSKREAGSTTHLVLNKGCTGEVLSAVIIWILVGKSHTWLDSELGMYDDLHTLSKRETGRDSIPECEERLC